MDQTDCGIKVSEWSDRQDVLKFFFGHWGMRSLTLLAAANIKTLIYLCCWSVYLIVHRKSNGQLQTE